MVLELALYSLVQPLLFGLPPETAHRLAMAVLECRLRWRGVESLPEQGRRCVMGLDFPNPIGLAAGFDKNGAHVDAIGNLGFGFIEVGGVTPQPQPGNPCPRVFRLPPAQALINRMGFNNIGARAMAANLTRRRYRGVLGINIGKNAVTPNEDAIADYLTCLEVLYPYGDFFTLNVSSPNTVGLREWQEEKTLTALLAAACAKRDALAQTHGKRAPLAVKIAPDLTDTDLVKIATIVATSDVDGVIACNTTLARPAEILRLPHGGEQGGLSGKPLTARATKVIKILRAELPDNIAVIGVGGIFTVDDMREKFAAGADLVQIYTGFIYEGDELPRRLVAGVPE